MCSKVYLNKGSFQHHLESTQHQNALLARSRRNSGEKHAVVTVMASSDDEERVTKAGHTGKGPGSSKAEHSKGKKTKPSNPGNETEDCTEDGHNQAKVKKEKDEQCWKVNESLSKLDNNKTGQSISSEESSVEKFRHGMSKLKDGRVINVRGVKTDQGTYCHACKRNYKKFSSHATSNLHKVNLEEYMLKEQGHDLEAASEEADNLSSIPSSPGPLTETEEYVDSQEEADTDKLAGGLMGSRMQQVHVHC